MEKNRLVIFNLMQVDNFALDPLRFFNSCLTGKLVIESSGLFSQQNFTLALKEHYPRNNFCRSKKILYLLTEIEPQMISGR